MHDFLGDENYKKWIQLKSYEVFIKSSFIERKEFGSQFFNDKSEE